MTKEYFGTKRIWAWKQEKDGKPGYAVKYSDGYISWSPENVFEAAYQPIDGMSFGHALVALKQGHKVARAGWNGKAMWIALTGGSIIEAGLARSGATKLLADTGVATIAICPHLDMKAADGSIVVGWLASQTDMLADDWTIVEPYGAPAAQAMAA